MEVMEDGNLMDKVHILIQRDMEYYTGKQAILQETICPGIIGGRLDFPRSASFAALKLVLWWEEEYVAAFKKPSGFLQNIRKPSRDDAECSTAECDGIVKDSDPSKFVNLIRKSADQLLEHLHMLTQEALDHADLTVLTGTIGAAALLKNCLWFYMQKMNSTKSNDVDQLQKGYKKYHEMCEALAERLLDLHCRLLSLYILQDAECLDWENDKPFFESERGSYTIQMWWLYMQGTKEDLWNTVPPKMAQRVFAGMLNESLTILTVRYTQSVPSEARSKLLVVDISNLLLCVAQLLPSICDTAKEFIGVDYQNSSKILRDIHTKCQELLSCLLLRGSSLNDLHKVFKKGADNVEMFKSRTTGPTPWIIFALPNMFKDITKTVMTMADLKSDISISLELMVLLTQPQPNWSLLLKVLCMKRCRVLNLILDVSMSNYLVETQKTFMDDFDCGAFLCSNDGSCKDVGTSSVTLSYAHYYDLILSTSEVLLSIGNDDDLSEVLISTIIRHQNWAKCFERRHVWNQIRPPWYEAMINLISPQIPTISETVVNAIQTGASMYQAMSLTIALFSHFWDSVNPVLSRVSALIQEFIPANIVPINNSALLQILVSALYSHLLRKSESSKKEVKFADSEPNNENMRPKRSVSSFDATDSSAESIALAIAEALCSIDEDNKHTDQIEDFLEQTRNCRTDVDFCSAGASRVESNQQMTEVLVSDLLISTSGKKSLKTLYHFIKHNNEWIYKKLGASEDKEEAIPNKATSHPSHLLHTMFHVGYRQFDQLLTGDWEPNWFNLLQTPMDLCPERAWMQLGQRWEFRELASTSLSSHDIHIVNIITSLLKQ